MLIDSYQAIDDSTKDCIEEFLSKILCCIEEIASQTLNYSSMQSNEPKLSLTQSIMVKNSCPPPLAQSSSAQ